jgi:BTB/POZ domain
VEVRANRTILGLRSPVFQKMLFGNFQEANEGIVNVDFPGTVVKDIVEYIHTNKTTSLREFDVARREGDGIPIGVQEEFQVLLTLTAAAAYYALPKLCHMVQKSLSSYLKAFPSLSFPLLDACSQEGPAIAENHIQIALSKVHKLLSGKDFDANALRNFSPTAVEFILVDGKSFLCAQDRFSLIDRWCKSVSSDADRHRMAKQLVKDHVDLQLIDPDALSASVTASGLVTLEQLAEAYKYQAKRAKRDFNLSFSFTYSNPTWNFSKSALTRKTESWKRDILNCPILLAGRRYTWTMNINGQLFCHVWIGVFCHPGHDRIVKSETAQHYGLRCDFQGGSECSKVGYHEVALGKGANIKNGDCVTMTLDLSLREDHNGTLSISVNSQPAVRIYADMLAKLASGSYHGFVPAVNCLLSMVTIVRIEEF